MMAEEKVAYPMECGICLSDESERLIHCKCGYCVCFGCQHMTKKLYCPNCGEEVSLSYIYKLVRGEHPLAIDHFITKHYRYDAKQENKSLEEELLFKNVKRSIISGEHDLLSRMVGKCKKCSKAIVNNSDDKNRNNCLNCDYSMCALCETEHPKNKECKQEDLDNMELVLKTSRKCPGCFIYVDKVDGCDHMRCLSCGTQFDWVSGKRHAEFPYLTKRDENVIYKPETMIEVRKLKHTVQKKARTPLTTGVKTFFIFVKKRISDTIDYLTKNLSREIENEYRKDSSEPSYETILSRVSMEHKKKLYENIMTLNYLSTIDDITKKGVTKAYSDSPLPKRYKISWEYFIKSLTETAVFEKIHGEFASSKKNLEMKPINYKQGVHVDRIVQKLNTLGRCLDMSPPGSGKTYSALLAIQKLKVEKLFILCTPLMKAKWTNVISDHVGTNNLEFIIKSYPTITLDGLRNSGLIKLESDDTKIITLLSDSFKNWLTDNKTAIIIDECHNIKSPRSFGFKFIYLLTTFAYEKKIPTLSMSGTPISCHADAISCTKKLFYENDPPRKSSIVKYPSFQRFTYLSESVEKNPFTNRKALLESIPCLQSIMDYKNSTNETYITDAIVRYKKKNSLDSDAFVRDLTKGYNAGNFLEFMKYIRWVEKYYDLRGNAFWAPNFSQGAWEYKIVGRNEGIIKNDLMVLGKVRNSIMRFNILYVYFLTISLKKYTRMDVIQPGTQSEQLMRNLQFFFFMYGAPLKYCAKETMTSLKTEKIVILILNKLRINIDDIPNPNDKKIELSTNKLELRDLHLDLSKDDEKKLKRYVSSNFFVTYGKTIVQLIIQHTQCVTLTLQIAERVLVEYTYDVVKRIRNDKRNFVIAYNYDSALDALKNKCKKDNTSYDIIDGSVPDKQAVIDKFQNESGQLLFIKMSSLNSGVDLDDKVGNTQRFVFIMPTHDITKLTQFIFRFQRVDSKSNSLVFIVHQLSIKNKLFDKLLYSWGSFDTSSSILNTAYNIYQNALISLYK